MVHPKGYDIEQSIATEIAPWIAGHYHGLWIQVASQFTIVVRNHEALITHRRRFDDKLGETSPNNLHQRGKFPQQRAPQQYSLSMSDGNRLSLVKKPTRTS